MSAATVSKASPTNRKRRRVNRLTNAQLATLDDVIVATIRDEQPVTLRGLYYRLVSAGLIDKTENDYDRVGRRLIELRENGRVPWAWITDNTRWMRKTRSYGSPAELLKQTATLYRRDAWRDSDDYVEVWLEKEALTGVMYSVAHEFDVPLMVSRGYASRTFLYSAAEAMANQAAAGKRVFVYYFGDHDPSGVNISAKIEETLRRYAPEVELEFERVAVTPYQIQAFGLPTRPTKQSDSRAAGFDGGSVEVDAIAPRDLRFLLRAVLESHLPPSQLDALREAEESERLFIAGLAERLELDGWGGDHE